MTLSDFIAYVKAFKLRSQAEVDAAILVAVPSQTSNSGKYLTTNGTVTSWGTVAAGSGLDRGLVLDALNVPTFL